MSGCEVRHDAVIHCSSSSFTQSSAGPIFKDGGRVRSLFPLPAHGRSNGAPGGARGLRGPFERALRSARSQRFSPGLRDPAGRRCAPGIGKLARLAVANAAPPGAPPRLCAAQLRTCEACARRTAPCPLVTRHERALDRQDRTDCKAGFERGDKFEREPEIVSRHVQGVLIAVGVPNESAPNRPTLSAGISRDHFLGLLMHDDSFK